MRVLSFILLKLWLAVRLKTERKKKKYQKHAQTIPYDNCYCGQSLINERKSSNSLHERTNRIEKKNDSNK